MSSTSSASRRRSGRSHVEDETLSQIAKEAEARLALKRAARIEAREIRMRELERQQRESQDKNERDVKSTASIVSRASSISGSSVPGSTPSASKLDANILINPDASTQELKEALGNLEEKYKKAMVQNAQLDNERTQLIYQTQQLRDLLEEQEDEFYRLKKENRASNQEVERQKRLLAMMTKRNSDLKYALEQRNELIEQQGLVLIGDSENTSRSTFAVITAEAAEILESAGDGSLDDRLRTILEERSVLQEQVKQLRRELSEHDVTNASNPAPPPSSSASEMQIIEIQREANRQLSEYKLKTQKYEQDITGLHNNVVRLEAQVSRHRQVSEAMERNEDEMRAERRKLQRDLRTALDRIEEYEITISHLEKRLERARASRNASGNS